MCNWKNKKIEQRKYILNRSLPRKSELKDKKNICYVNYQP